MGSVPRDPKRRSGAAGTVVPDMSTTTRSAHRTMLAASPMAGIQKEMEGIVRTGRAAIVAMASGTPLHPFVSLLMVSKTGRIAPVAPRRLPVTGVSGRARFEAV